MQFAALGDAVCSTQGCSFCRMGHTGTQGCCLQHSGMLFSAQGCFQHTGMLFPVQGCCFSPGVLCFLPCCSPCPAVLPGVCQAGEPGSPGPGCGCAGQPVCRCGAEGTAGSEQGVLAGLPAAAGKGTPNPTSPHCPSSPFGILGQPHPQVCPLKVAPSKNWGFRGWEGIFVTPQTSQIWGGPPLDNQAHLDLCHKMSSALLLLPLEDGKILFPAPERGCPGPGS